MTIDWPNVIAGALLSAPVSAFVAWLFYRFATRDLLAETEKLRALNEKVFRAAMLGS